MARAKRCPDCYGRGFWGDGRCPGCAGSGKSLSLSHPELQCWRCQGTGICTTCNGFGRLGTGAALLRPLPPMRKLLILPLLLAVCLTGVWLFDSRCLAKATSSSEVFHRALSEDKVARIYADADDSFRHRWRSDAAAEQLNEIRRRLADCQAPVLSSWRVSAATNGVYVLTRYAARCPNGEVREALLWRIVHGSAKLTGLRATTVVRR